MTAAQRSEIYIKHGLKLLKNEKWEKPVVLEQQLAGRQLATSSARVEKKESTNEEKGIGDKWNKKNEK